MQDTSTWLLLPFALNAIVNLLSLLLSVPLMLGAKYNRRRENIERILATCSIFSRPRTR